jgi:hypothetical protein
MIIKTHIKPQSQIGEADYSIVAVRGRIYDVALSTADTGLEASFYFEFLAENGSVKQIKEANRESIFKGIYNMLPDTLSDDGKETKANEETDKVIKAILAGTKTQRYAAMAAFAAAYGLVLLPLAEQNGVLASASINSATA